MGKKRKKRKNNIRGCEGCSNMIYCGEGNFICNEDKEPHDIMEDYFPADDYFWCGGKNYE
jgi:hypothetical protein